MKSSRLAIRYARALFSLCVTDADAGRADRIAAQLGVLVGAFAVDPGPLRFLSSPLYRSVEKAKFVEGVVASLPFDKTLKDFLVVCARKNRMGHLAEIARAFGALNDDRHGVVRGVARSATALGPAERDRLAKTLGSAVGRDVVLDFEIDPALLGGVVAEVGRFTFDDSLRAQLNRLQDKITRSA